MSAPSAFLIVPLFLGMLYSLSAIALKRAMVEGADIWRTILYSNLAIAVFMLPLLAFIRQPGEGAAYHQPLLTGLALFAGFGLNILALQRGHVSVVAPLLGTKVLFVAAFTVLVVGVPVRTPLWLASLLVCLAMPMLRGGGGTAAKFGEAVVYAMGSASAFALADVFFQAWARRWGVGLFIPMAFGLACLLTVGLRRWFASRSAPLPRAAWRWLAAACLLHGLQAFGMFLCVSLYRHPNAAAAVNIVYNSRGIWSVMLVWAAGSWFGNIEGRQGVGVMGRRLVGALMLLIAVAITLLLPV
jgi:uncharacterized membrane protein